MNGHDADDRAARVPRLLVRLKDIICAAYEDRETVGRVIDVHFWCLEVIAIPWQRTWAAPGRNLDGKRRMQYETDANPGNHLRKSCRQHPADTQLATGR